MNIKKSFRLLDTEMKAYLVSWDLKYFLSETGQLTSDLDIDLLFSLYSRADPSRISFVDFHKLLS
jgi:Ca2+-binding EF-hand superfamily protein